jgi:hypothetical protein
MKFNVRPKVEATEQLNIRVPASLKHRIDSVRALADQAGVDYNATLIGVIDQFNTELEAQLRQTNRKSGSGANSQSTQTAIDSAAPGLPTNGRKVVNS